MLAVSAIVEFVERVIRARGPQLSDEFETNPDGSRKKKDRDALVAEEDICR